MTTRLTIELSDELLAKIQEWGPTLANRLGRPVTVAETLSTLIDVGARHAAGAYRDDVPVGSLTARELANLFGVSDIEKARAMARAELERAEKMRAEISTALGHAGELKILGFPTTLSSPAEASAYFHQVAALFASLPGCQLVVSHAWYDPAKKEHVAPMTTPAPKGAS